MSDTVAHAMLVVPQFASVCCVVGDRYRPRPGVVVPAAVMLVAMVLPAVGADAGVTVLAAALLLVVAPLPVIGRRRGRDGRRAEPMDVHRALSSVVMAGMLLMEPVTRSGGAVSAGQMAHGIAISAVLGGGVIGYCAFSGWLLRYEWNRPDRRSIRSGEVFAMTVAVIGMTLAM